MTACLLLSLSMEFISTTPGGRSLIYEGFRYHVDRRGRDGRNFWRCNNCRSFGGALTTLNGEIISTWAACEAEIVALKCLDKRKKKSSSIIPKSMIEIPATGNQEKIAAHFPTFPAIKSALYRIRRQSLPPLPQSRSQVHFEGEWTRTHSGAQFLFAEQGNEEYIIIIFTTADNIMNLSNADRIYLDGTFQTCPSLFYQIFTFHAFKNLPINNYLRL